MQSIIQLSPNGLASSILCNLFSFLSLQYILFSVIRIYLCCHISLFFNILSCCPSSSYPHPCSCLSALSPTTDTYLVPSLAVLSHLYCSWLEAAQHNLLYQWKLHLNLQYRKGLIFMLGFFYLIISGRWIFLLIVWKVCLWQNMIDKIVATFFFFIQYL